MNGIRVTWTRRREENMEALLTYDQVRTRFGLGGTPDGLIRTRLRQIAGQDVILAFAEEQGDTHLISSDASHIIRLAVSETDQMPDPDQQVCTCERPLAGPQVCRTCHRPLPGTWR